MSRGVCKQGTDKSLGGFRGLLLGEKRGSQMILRPVWPSKSRIQSLPLTPGSGVRGRLVSVRWPQASGDVRDVYSRSQTDSASHEK